MNLQLLKLILILADRKITGVPLRTLAELRRQGKKRVPEEIDRELSFYSGWKTLKLAKNWLDGENITRHHGKWVLNSFLPPFPSPAFNRMFENLLSGRRLSPVSAFLAVTPHCPFNCVHCSVKHRKSGNLTTAQWRQAIDALTSHGTSIIGFTGGEPLTRPDLPILVNEAAERDATTVLFSSGSGFDAAMAKQLKKAGLWSVCISLDYSDREQFNRFRGSKKAYATAVSALQTAIDHGFYTMIGSVGNRPHIETGEYARLHELAAQLGVHELRIVEPMPCGRMKDAPEEALLTPDHIDILRKFHTGINRRGKKPKVCAFNHVESPELFGCGGGTQHLYIDSAGEVCPCDFTPMSFGNFTAEPFAEIWNRMTGALGNPRRHCLIRKHHGAINEMVKESGKYPLPPELSCKICANTEKEDFPDYFQMVTGRKR